MLRGGIGTRGSVAGLVPRVLLHGFTGSVESWRPVLQFIDGGPWVALAIPGHHPSACVQKSFVRNVDWLVNVLGLQGIFRFHLIGYSMGARLALGIGARYPRRVVSMTLIGVHPGLCSDKERSQRLHADSQWSTLLRNEGIGAFVAQWEMQPLFASQQRLDSDILHQQRQIRLSHDPELLAAAIECCGLASMPNYYSVFQRETMPIQLVVGARDSKFLSIAQSIVAECPSIRLCKVEGVGHNVLVERPQQLVTVFPPG